MLHSDTRGHAMHRFLLAALASLPAVAIAQDCAPTSLQFELLRRNEADQNARKTLSADPLSKEALDRVLRIDRENTAYMRTVVTTCGWPKQSAVGEQAAKAAWRITQHADMDPQYQVLAAHNSSMPCLARKPPLGTWRSWSTGTVDLPINRRCTACSSSPCRTMSFDSTTSSLRANWTLGARKSAYLPSTAGRFNYPGKTQMPPLNGRKECWSRRRLARTFRPRPLIGDES